MSARHRINSLIFCGALVIAGIVGGLSGSAWAFIVTIAGLLLAATVSRDIRLR